ncbi:MAG: hypothetical protein KUF77_09815 [Candidatus Thiodiazotropha sp. (ex Lucina aurantia)]|nr:hypothetical protein [Candidatus Thiodiazotropha taylori]MBV2097821.1 hypothetical protein [Candidatus Thiodiazotropha sp. (ex Codakia orbicularis)]MBV2103306.1 hypothetical protein [Candidatus Thiodiazotropha sp. (ex Lucina aurantia)]MBV2116331.1 hypothetical protein [Candidatus Thiodiazotropha sp. (ex Lucina aurantia)]
MTGADTPAWMQALLMFANEKGKEAARNHFTKGLTPSSRQYQQVEAVLAQLEQDNDTGRWRYKPL